MSEAPEPAYEGWAIVEIFGNRVTAGLVREVEMVGEKFLRIDTPGPDGEVVCTQHYGGKAIYCLTPCTEEAARKALRRTYELPPAVRLALPAPATVEVGAAGFPDDDGDEGPEAVDESAYFDPDPDHDDPDF